MKKFLKRALATALTVTAFALTACTGSGGNSGDGTFDDGDGKKIVSVYTFNDKKTNDELNAAIENDFYKKYPDIKIKTRISTDNFYTNLLNDFEGRTEADVFNMEPGEIYSFLRSDYLEPLDKYFSTSSISLENDIWSINKDAYAYDKATTTFGTGSTYAVMKDWTTDSMLLYNRSMLTEKQLQMIEGDEDGDGVADPLTFDEFEQLCDELLVKSGKDITRYSFLPGLAEAKVLEQFITNAGLCWYKDDYSANFSDPAVKEVVEYYYGILAKNEVYETGSTFYPLFASGNCAMIMGGLYCIDSYGLSNMDLGVAYPPVKEKGMQSKPYTTGCVGFSISSRSKVKEEAFKFIEWYLEYYGKKNAETCNNFPAIKKYTTEIILNPEVNKVPVKLNAAQKFYESLDKAVVIDRNPYCSQASVETVEFTYAGEYMQGMMNLNQFCQTLDKEINKRVNANK